jgi:hypothetical protein
LTPLVAITGNPKPRKTRLLSVWTKVPDFKECPLVYLGNLTTASWDRPKRRKQKELKESLRSETGPRYGGIANGRPDAASYQV